MINPRKLYWSWLDLVKLYRTQGLAGLRERYASREPLDVFPDVAPFLNGKCGLEIGGPTPMFGRGKALPVYAIAKRVDNSNFSRDTYWQGRIHDGEGYKFDRWKTPGYQYVMDGVKLARIESESYDFVLSSHNIEHIANPIAALNEWIRVLRDDGRLVIVVPHGEGTFDHRRPVTSLAHIIDDYLNATTEDDQTHIPEILQLHDLERDPSVRTAAEFRELALNNAAERRLHHHVFDTRLVLELLDHTGLQICAVTTLKPFHIIVIAKKLRVESPKRNEQFLAPDAQFRHRSAFASDRVTSTA